VLPSNSGQGYQEFNCGAQGHDSTLDNAMSECAAFGLLPAEAAEEVARVIAVVNTWQAHFAKMGVSAVDIEHLANFIDGDELLRQRRDFETDRYLVAKPRGGKGGRRSPFRP
jgi:serine/threonine-protein kinase HipA